MAESKDLLQVLWSGADVLRGKMVANEYKTYLLGLIFYKYLSVLILQRLMFAEMMRCQRTCRRHRSNTRKQ